MKIIPETIDDVVALVAANFRSFGGGQANTRNPISMALADKPAQFAGGVDIKDVVTFVLKNAPKPTSGKRSGLPRPKTNA